MPKATKKQLTEELSFSTSVPEKDVILPRLHIPATKAQVDALEVGKKATVTVTGKVKRLSTEAADDDGSHGSIEIEIDSSEAYMKKDNKFRDMAEESGVIGEGEYE